MQKRNRTRFPTTLLLVAIASFVIAAVLALPKPVTATNGIGVIGCGGMIAVIVTRSDGSVSVYDAENEPNEEQKAEALSVPVEERKSILACPVMMLPQAGPVA